MHALSVNAEITASNIHRDVAFEAKDRPIIYISGGAYVFS